MVITAQGSAVHWQARVHYYWYRKVQKQCQEERGVDCQMGGFTRILHSGQPDELMEEIPTHVVEPLQDKDNKGWGPTLAVTSTGRSELPPLAG